MSSYVISVCLDIVYRGDPNANFHIRLTLYLFYFVMLQSQAFTMVSITDSVVVSLRFVIKSCLAASCCLSPL